MEHPPGPEAVVTATHLPDTLAPLRQYVATPLDTTKTPRDLDELELDQQQPYPDGEHYVWFTHKQEGYRVGVPFEHYRRFRGFKFRVLRLVCRHPDGQAYVVHVDHQGQVIGAAVAQVDPAVRQRLPLAPGGARSA